MTEACVEDGCKMEVDEETQSMRDKFIRFEEEVDKCKRFDLMGEVPDTGDIRLRDTTKEYGEDNSCVDIPVDEILRVSPKQILAVARQERSDVVCRAYTRVVGYYSQVNNWNQGKQAELLDRHNGNYTSRGFVNKNQEESSAAVERMLDNATTTNVELAAM